MGGDRKKKKGEGFFILPAEKVKDGGRFFVFPALEIVDGGSSFFGAGRTKNPAPHLRRRSPPSSKKPPLSSIFCPIFGTIFGAEDRRWGVLRSSGPKVEDQRWGDSSFFGAENRRRGGGLLRRWGRVFFDLRLRRTKNPSIFDLRSEDCVEDCHRARGAASLDPV